MNTTLSIPEPKLAITLYCYAPELNKTPFTIVGREFNPEGAPNSNQWYYTPSFDKNRRIREDFLISKLKAI